MILAYTSSLSILLPGGMVFFTYRHQKPELKIISAFIIFSLVVDALGIYLYLNGKNNLYLFHAFTWVENILLSLYFFRLFREKIARNITLLLAILFFLFWAISLYQRPQMLDGMPRETRIVECLVMMVYCIYFYFELFLSSENINLMRYPHYWLVSGFLLYFAGTLFLNIIGDMAINTAQLGFYGYDIHNVLHIFLNLIFTLTLWIGRKASTSAQF